jgi:hypothetical protein
MSKKQRGKLSGWKDRWCLLMSSRPMDKENYLIDLEQLKDDFLPTLVEFDTLYYYDIKSDGPPKGKIICKDILNIQFLAGKNYFSFLVDVGFKKYEFSTGTRAQCEQWIEALELCKKTAMEVHQSITGSVKNIS